MDELIQEAATELAEFVEDAVMRIELITSLIKLRRELDDYGN